MKKALPNTKVTAKLRKSNYKDEWYLIIESYPVYKRGSKRASRVVESINRTGLYPHQFGTNRPLHESCRMEHSIINLNVI